MIGLKSNSPNGLERSKGGLGMSMDTFGSEKISKITLQTKL